MPFSASSSVTNMCGGQPMLLTALNATRDDQYLALYNSGSSLFVYSKTGGVYNGNNFQAGTISGVFTVQVD